VVGFVAFVSSEISTCIAWLHTLLVTAGFLEPLGHPARNSTKFFATETLEQFRREEKWLACGPESAISGVKWCAKAPASQRA
jgi:hypothetical protein